MLIDMIFQENVFENDAAENAHVCSVPNMWNMTFVMNCIPVIPYLNMYHVYGNIFYMHFMHIGLIPAS